LKATFPPPPSPDVAKWEAVTFRWMEVLKAFGCCSVEGPCYFSLHRSTISIICPSPVVEIGVVF
jgi:hypothetical protein